MEIHAPEHPIHTWREFFIHMGTICLGLLIAIGIEQTVEAIPPEELQTYVDLLQDKTDVLNFLAIANHELHNANATVMTGETNLSKAQNAERQ